MACSQNRLALVTGAHIEQRQVRVDKKYKAHCGGGGEPEPSEPWEKTGTIPILTALRSLMLFSMCSFRFSQPGRLRDLSGWPADVEGTLCCEQTGLDVL